MLLALRSKRSRAIVCGVAALTAPSFAMKGQAVHDVDSAASGAAPGPGVEAQLPPTKPKIPSPGSAAFEKELGTLLQDLGLDTGSNKSPAQGDDETQRITLEEARLARLQKIDLGTDSDKSPDQVDGETLALRQEFVEVLCELDGLRKSATDLVAGQPRLPEESVTEHLSEQSDCQVSLPASGVCDAVKKTQLVRAKAVELADNLGIHFCAKCAHDDDRLSAAYPGTEMRYKKAKAKQSHRWGWVEPRGPLCLACALGRIDGLNVVELGMRWCRDTKSEKNLGTFNGERLYVKRVHLKSVTHYRLCLGSKYVTEPRARSVAVPRGQGADGGLEKWVDRRVNLLSPPQQRRLERVREDNRRSRANLE